MLISLTLLAGSGSPSPARLRIPTCADSVGPCLQNTYLFEAMWLFCVLLVLLLLGRAAFIFPISFLHNVWSREKLGLKEMVIIW